MSSVEQTKVVVDVERLDPDMIQKHINDHLRDSTAVLQEMLNDSDKLDDGEEESEEGCMCQHCGKIYKTVSSLQSHDLLMHPENEIEGQCTSCDKKYPSVLSLQKHMRYMHHHQHRCKVCYRTFATDSQLFLHGEGCTKMETPCSKCEKVFTSQIALRNHTRYKHPHNTNHWCELCRRTFTTKLRLMNHTVTIHPLGATNCTWCDKPFTSVTSLQSHILYRHSGDRAKCLKCHKVFAKKSALQRHQAKKHVFNDNTN